MTTVIIADDHKILLQGLASLLADADGIDLLGTADDGDRAAELVREHQPDIAVCDVSMPTFGALELSRFIDQNALPTRVVALTVHEDPAIARPVLDAGVSGYVLKKHAFESLLQAIEAAVAGDRFISSPVADKLLQSASDSVELSEREREVLTKIGQGLPYKKIAADLGIGLRTVETYRTRLLQKLELKTSADLIRYAAQRDL